MDELGTTKIKPFPELAALEDTPASDQVIILSVAQLRGLIEHAIQPLRDEISELKATITAVKTTEDNDINYLSELIMQDRKRLAVIERKDPEKDPPLLDELYKEMKAQRRKQADFATAARMIKRSKARLFQLKSAIALDQRFILIPSESHSQKLLIRLREFYKPV